MRTMKKRILGVFVLAAMLILALAFTACEGPEGPMGPEGPAGGVDPNCVHAWQQLTIVNTSTCTESGKQITMSCVKCSAVVEGDVTQPKGHLLNGTVILSTQPTEATDGTATGVHCTRIGCTAIVTFTSPVTIPAWNKFYGTWVYTSGGSSSTFIISKTTLNLVSNSTAEYEIISWTPSINIYSNNDSYPNGYSFNLKNTSNQSTTTYSAYLHTNVQSLNINSSVYNKQQ